MAAEPAAFLGIRTGIFSLYAKHEFHDVAGSDQGTGYAGSSVSSQNRKME